MARLLLVRSWYQLLLNSCSSCLQLTPRKLADHEESTAKQYNASEGQHTLLSRRCLHQTEALFKDIDSFLWVEIDEHDLKTWGPHKGLQSRHFPVELPRRHQKPLLARGGGRQLHETFRHPGAEAGIRFAHVL